MSRRSKSVKAATAEEVGRLAGVSQSAVSRVFTPGRSVSKKTREKVLRAAEQLGYRPNFIARSLTTRRSNIVGLAIAPLENPFYSALVKGLSHGLRGSGRHLLLFPAVSQVEPDPEIDEVLGYQVDALILASTTLSSRLVTNCDRLGVPVLLINRISAFAGVSTIAGENRRGGETIARYLIASGHQRLAFISGLETTSTSRDREAGFLSEIARNGLRLFGRETGNYAAGDAALAARNLMSKKERPDAIFVANDFMAIAVINTIRKDLGLRVPEDVSIIGFDAVPDIAYSGYELTSFSQPVEGFVEHVVDVLDLLLAKPGEHIHLEVRGQLIVGTTARVPSIGVVNVGDRRVWLPEQGSRP